MSDLDIDYMARLARAGVSLDKDQVLALIAHVRSLAATRAAERDAAAMEGWRRGVHGRTAEIDAAEARGAAKERSAVVTWLMRRGYPGIADDFAARIERGEHIDG